MIFNITIETEKEVGDKWKVIQELANSMNEYFISKEYGQGIQKYLIGCILIKTRIGYENWYKKRVPRYKSNSLIKKLDGSTETINLFTYDIKFDDSEYNAFINSPIENGRKILAHKLLDSLECLESLPHKVKNFDKDKFKSDFTNYLVSNNLL